MMQDVSYNQENEMSLVDLFLMIKKYFLFLVIFTLLGGGLAAIYAFGISPKTYESNVQIMVNGQHQSIKDFYMSDYVLRQILKEVEIDTDIEEIREGLTITFNTSSKFMDISFEFNQRNYTRIILVELLEVTQELIENNDNYKAYQGLITYPLNPTAEERVAPNYLLVIFIGMVLAGMISLGYVFIREMMNPKYQSQKDLEKALEIDCIGLIPTFDQKGGNHHA